MQLPAADDISVAENYPYLLHLNRSDLSEVLTHVNSADTMISNITFPSNDTSVAKRWDAANAPLATWFDQWPVAQQAYWDQIWYPASGCQYTGYSNTALAFSQRWSQTI